ncbi:helix-turn-helix domain-containing protein [Sphingomonas sp. 37zxx]|uniref:helix-turn-helix domain-containing protein n=1 Tax=Sphingomonas sp. 37zxx TaxID=1550073 RepID=UPI00068F1896|nr:helix-turn-helix domain-containing protein [Sphingomonas sp. 37zxx]
MTDEAEGAIRPPIPTTVGEGLRLAREAQGLALSDIAQRTRIPLRHLEAIEASNYISLPSITYAMGFTRAYARMIGADEVEIARDLRIEIADTWEAVPRHEPYDLTDPARVPPRGLALAGVAVAVLLLIGVALWYGTGLFRTEEAPPAEMVVATAPVPPPASIETVQPTGAGQVTLTASDEVWVRVYDANDKTLLMKTLQPGERYDVPMAAEGPMINVGRPDQLTVTIDGSAVPPLGDGRRAIKDVALSAEALRARSSATTPDA